MGKYTTGRGGKGAIVRLSRPQGITRGIWYIVKRARSTWRPHITYRGLVEPRDELAEGLRIVGLQRGKHLVDL